MDNLSASWKAAAKDFRSRHKGLLVRYSRLQQENSRLRGEIQWLRSHERVRIVGGCVGADTTNLTAP